MASEKLEKDKWKQMLDRLTKSVIGKSVEIEVASLGIGDQIEAEWTPLVGIAYDPKDDLVEVAVGDEVDHLINKPKEIYVDIGASGLISLEVVDGDDVRHIIKLRDPLMLPPPEDARRPQSARR
jgi:hypothetical protein